MSSGQTKPLTFDLQEEFLKKLDSLRRRTGARSLSEVVRYAIDQVKLSELTSSKSAHRQLSVRLSVELRGKLFSLSRQKNLSLGEVLRGAIEALPDDPKDFNPKTNMPKKPAPKKKAPAKAAPKAPAKKAVKKKVAKLPAKKAVKKVVAKKAVKKAPAKKAAKKAVKKAPAKKAVKKAVKKAPAKKAAKKAAKKK